MAVKHAAELKRSQDEYAAPKKPSMFLVILLNDDVTTMEFVVELLMAVFDKTQDEAMALMLGVHESGSGVAGRYIYDIAATKRAQAKLMAEKAGFPLKITVEEEI